jgi:hypothetical protein
MSVNSISKVRGTSNIFSHFLNMPVNKRMRDLLEVKTPEAAYVLGFIWADGCIQKHSKNSYRINGMNNIESDALELLPTFLKTAKWNVGYIKQRKRSSQPQIMLRISSSELGKFLTDHDYGIKSKASACKILSVIPKNLHHYFFRGVIDGDGSFYIQGNSKPDGSKKISFVINGSFDQDWTYFKKLLNQLDIRYKYNVRDRGSKGRSSSIEFYRHEDVLKFGRYIYEGYTKNPIGLSRKFTKLTQIELYSQDRPSVGKYIRKNKKRTKPKPDALNV